MHDNRASITVVPRPKQAVTAIANVGLDDVYGKQPTHPLVPVFLRNNDGLDPLPTYRKWLWQQVKTQHPPVWQALQELKQQAVTPPGLRLYSATYPRPSHVDVVRDCLDWMIRGEQATTCHAQSPAPQKQAVCPVVLVQAVEQVMGRIDVQITPDAQAIPSSSDDYHARWRGNLFLTLPVAHDHPALWINRLVTGYEMGRVEQACCLTPLHGTDGWQARLFDYAVCFLTPDSWPEESTLAREQMPADAGLVVAYLGDHIISFIRAFKPLGRIMLPEWRIEAAALVRMKETAMRVKAFEQEGLHIGLHHPIFGAAPQEVRHAA